MADAPHPGEILREDFVKPSGLSVTDLAAVLGISRKNLSQILNEKTGISAEMAIRLSKVFKTSAKVWTGIQMEYELSMVMKNVDTIEVGELPSNLT
ncbi:MAG: HigA family addiction module antitoxin [Cyclobacteriaceae bacterium]